MRLILLICLFMTTTAFADKKANNNNNNNNNNVIVVPQHCEKPREVVKWRTVYKDKVVYRDRIIEKPVIKYVTKIKIVEKPVIRYVDKPRVIVKTKTKIKRVVRKIKPPKNALSLFAMSGKDKFEVEDTGTQVKVNREQTYDLGIKYQRDYKRVRGTIGVTQDSDVLIGLGLNW